MVLSIDHGAEKTAAIERQIVTAMIVSDRCLRSLIPFYKPKLFLSSYPKLIASWCIEYYTQYNKSPKGTIRDIYDAKRRHLDETDSLIIREFLSSISIEYERQDTFNEDYYIDRAVEYFNERELYLLKEEIESYLSVGNITLARAAVARFNRPSTARAKGHEPFTDIECCRRAFESAADELLIIPGAFGELLRPLQRNSLVAIAALYKTGKSFVLDYIGRQAWYSGLNVAVFDLEMGQEVRDLRGYCAITGLPLPDRDDERKEVEVTVPVWDCLYNQDNTCNSKIRKSRIGVLDPDGNILKQTPLEYEPCYIESCPQWKVGVWRKKVTLKPVSWRTAWRKCSQLNDSVHGARYKVQNWPANSATIEDLQSVLDIWECTEGFVPDVILVDMPSLFRSASNMTGRDFVDYTWRELRKCSQQRNALVIAVVQAGGKEVIKKRESGRDLSESDVAEDSRIIGHVVKLIHLHQTEEENELGVIRASKSAERNASFRRSEQVVILQSLETGQPVLDSKWRK